MLKRTRRLVSETAAPVLTFLIWAIVAGAVLGCFSLGFYWFAEPTRVAIDNRVFHESQPYNDGMARDLENLQMAYSTATPEGRASLRAIIRHRFAGYDASRLPLSLQSFLTETR